MIKIKELFTKYREMILYLFFGGCTTLVNIVSYYICSRIGMGTALSTVIAWVLSVLFAYVTNRKYVFESKAFGFVPILKEIAGFFLCRLATGLLDLAIMVVFVDFLHFNDMIIKILSNIIVIILNYAASKLLIFKDKSSDNKTKNPMLFKALSGFPFALRALFCFYIAVTLLLLVFIDKSLNVTFTPNVLTVSNKLLILPSLLLLILFIGALYLLQRIQDGRSFKKELSEKQFYIIISLIFVAVYVLQLFISSHIYLKSDWDVAWIRKAAENIAVDNPDGVPISYFYSYQNNVLITYTLAFLYRVGNFFVPSHPYAVILVFVSFLVCVSVYLMVLCIYRITRSRKLTVCGMIIGILLVALNPWIVIPYTDSIPMIFPVFAVFCYLYVKNIYLRYSLMTLSCALGYCFKPTIIIVLIALAILKLFVLIEKLLRKKLSFKRCACMLLCIVISLGIPFGINKSLKNKMGLIKDSQITMTHYFMMGLNVETDGIYNDDDVLFTKNLPNLESRQKGNISVAISRLKEMGVKGYIRLLTVKNIATYNDGTFGWGKEGTFYLEVPEDNRTVTKALRSFYYTNEQGTHYLVFATAEQILWLFMLICICFCVLPFKTKGGAENLIALSLLGVSMFLLIFECRARYLFVFSPLFVILATVGLYKAYLLADKYVFKT